MEQHKAFYESEIGILEILGTEQGVTSILFVPEMPTSVVEVHPCLQECINQLDEYFRGIRKTFSVKLDQQGTAFQKNVWNQLRSIPYGETVTYLKIAELIGNQKAVRAVGAANGKNKISIIVPCHRVIGQNGTLTGYAGGLWRKKWLLEHEKRY